MVGERSDCLASSKARSLFASTKGPSSGGAGTCAGIIPGRGSDEEMLGRDSCCFANGSGADAGAVVVDRLPCSAGADIGVVSDRALVPGRFGNGSRLTPRRNSRPSLRQFLAMAENCSRCHFTMILDPMLIGVLRRMQAPDREVSSRVPAARLDVPLWSCQQTSATAHSAVLGSMLRPSMPCVSAEWCQSLVPAARSSRALVGLSGS